MTIEISEETKAALEGMDTDDRSSLARMMLQVSRYAATAAAVDQEGSAVRVACESVGTKFPQHQAFYTAGGVAGLLSAFKIDSLEELEMALVLYAKAFPEKGDQ